MSPRRQNVDWPKLAILVVAAAIALLVAFPGCATTSGPTLPPPVPVELEQEK